MTDSLGLEDIYAMPGLGGRAPQVAFPAKSMIPHVAYQLVHDELLLDGVSRTNLATFCTTWIDEYAQQLMQETIDKNIVDKDEYPQTAALEQRCVRMLADLFHSPNPARTAGTSTTGSSEAAMLGGLAAKFRWRARGGGDDGDRPNFVAGPVQVCWEKFARYFDVEIRQVPLRDGRYKLEPDDIAAHCDENTIMVVATMGQTFTGLYEDVEGISVALDTVQRETGWDIPIHVDAASGGFLAPFTAPELRWDFRLPRVKSINVSGHKAGLAPLGVGWAIWREVGDLPRELIFDVDYLGGDMPTFNLNFSRPGGQAITSYYEFIRLGKVGYTGLQKACYSVAQYIAQKLPEIGPFDLIHDGNPDKGICAVSWRMKSNKSYNLYDVADRMRTHGWLIVAYPLPDDRGKEVVMRTVIRHGFTHDMADLMLADLTRSVKQLKSATGLHSLTREESGGFAHDARPAVPLPKVKARKKPVKAKAAKSKGHKDSKPPKAAKPGKAEKAAKTAKPVAVPRPVAKRATPAKTPAKAVSARSSSTRATAARTRTPKPPTSTAPKRTARRR